MDNGFNYHTHTGGLAGIAHIYNRIYKYTDRIEFKDAAIYWFEQTLQMAKFDDGLAGYKV